VWCFAMSKFVWSGRPLIMATLWNRACHYIFAMWFLLLLLSFFLHLISAVADRMSAIFPHMVWP